jgi:hypothetical protein
MPSGVHAATDIHTIPDQAIRRIITPTDPEEFA